MSSENLSECKELFKDHVQTALLKQRTITIFGEITQKAARDFTEKLMVLAGESKDSIRVIINSPGGHVESGDTIFDMIRFVGLRILMIGTGRVASAGALIYSAPPREDRFSLPNTRFMLHQPSGGVGGSASDAEIEAKEIIKMRERLNRTFAERTGQSLGQVTKDSDRNFWMSPKQAVEYGLAGKVIRSVDELK
ncbi:MAG: ATP-dependent Clp protease proteolytic subunit [Verrucomicrobia subdivision 3 bacterium]|nr:ATP-dependent Clp protease proteolytic subunit [Limisphaerales bacterium]MCS1413347.1 ATP-dependent Clp protease proteolytic subunit [Limisphaerales bacterium]